MTANDGDVHGGHIEALLLGIKGLGAHNIECCDTEHLALIINSQALKGLSGDGDSGIDRVGNNVQDGLIQG